MTRQGATQDRRIRTRPRNPAVRAPKCCVSRDDSPHLYDRGVLLAPLDELVECKFGVFIAIHVAENFVHSLFAGDQTVSVEIVEW